MDPEFKGIRPVKWLVQSDSFLPRRHIKANTNYKFTARYLALV